MIKDMEKIYDEDKIKKYLEHKAYRNYFSSAFDSYAYLVRCEQNETLIHQGEEAVTLYFLMEGRCRVKAINNEGRVFIINTITAPNIVGEIELISEDESFSVETIDKSLFIALPYSSFKEKLLKDSRFLLHLCATLTEKERDHALKMTQLASFPLENRLASFILENSYKDKLTLRKTVIAESLGVSYRHLEKVMKDFTEAGILDKDKRTYVIRDKKELMRKASVLDIF